MSSSKFTNPLAFTEVQDFLVAILNVMIIVALPIVVFILIYAGFMYVTARGNAEQLQQASRALLYGAIGGVIILGSIAITQIISAVAGAF
jgi:hypothetical protein